MYICVCVVHLGSYAKHETRNAAVATVSSQWMQIQLKAGVLIHHAHTHASPRVLCVPNRQSGLKARKNYHRHTRD